MTHRLTAHALASPVFVYSLRRIFNIVVQGRLSGLGGGLRLFSSGFRLDAFDFGVSLLLRFEGLIEFLLQGVDGFESLFMCLDYGRALKRFGPLRSIRLGDRTGNEVANLGRLKTRKDTS